MKPTDEQIEDFSYQFLKAGQVNNDVIKEAFEPFFQNLPQSPKDIKS